MGGCRWGGGHGVSVLACDFCSEEACRLPGIFLWWCSWSRRSPSRGECSSLGSKSMGRWWCRMDRHLLRSQWRWGWETWCHKQQEQSDSDGMWTSCRGFLGWLSQGCFQLDQEYKRQGLPHFVKCNLSRSEVEASGTLCSFLFLFLPSWRTEADWWYFGFDTFYTEAMVAGGLFCKHVISPHPVIKHQVLGSSYLPSLWNMDDILKGHNSA